MSATPSTEPSSTPLAGPHALHARPQAGACAAPGAEAFVGPYRFVHKALLAMLSDALVKLGQANEAPPPISLSLIDQLEQVLAACGAHMAQEEAWVHEALKSLAPRVVAPMDNDHIEQSAQLGRLQAAVQALRASPEPEPGFMHALYLQLSQFVGEALAHMAEEDARMTPALQAHFTPAQLAELTRRWQAAWAPWERQLYAHWMPRALNPSELDTWQQLSEPLP